MPKRKGIFKDERRGLPDEPHVTLTEAVTWIATGDCRTDEHVSTMWRLQGDQNQREWGSRYGPAWLLRHLELLARGEEWQFDETVGEEDRQSMLRQFEKTKDWLAASGADPAAAYERAKDQCDHDDAEAARFEACEEMIFKACAAGEVELLGIRFTNGRWEGVHTAIPHTYFLQPVFHRRGLKPEGSSWGQLVEADLTPATRPEYSDIERDDSRPAYLAVVIPRDDVRHLKQRFQDRKKVRRSISKPSGFSRVEVKRWFQDRVRNWDAAKPPPSERTDLDAAKQEFPGLTREPFREIRRWALGRWAPDWLKRGPRRAPIARK